MVSVSSKGMEHLETKISRYFVHLRPESSVSFYSAEVTICFLVKGVILTHHLAHSRFTIVVCVLSIIKGDIRMRSLRGFLPQSIQQTLSGHPEAAEPPSVSNHISLVNSETG